MNHLCRLIVWVCKFFKLFLCFLYLWTYLLWYWITRIVIVNILSCKFFHSVSYFLYYFINNCFRCFSLIHYYERRHICPLHIITSFCKTNHGVPIQPEKNQKPSKSFLIIIIISNLPTNWFFYFHIELLYISLHLFILWTCWLGGVHQHFVNGSK